jgi:DNA (cytosine-5)-methyltransferase 1
MVSILNCEQAYYFPTPVELTKRLKDVLEDSVDEKYYLSQQVIDGFNARKERHDAAGDGFGRKPTDGDCIAASVTTQNGSRNTDNFIKEPMIGAFRGRNPENPSERGRSNGMYKQRLEINENGTSNTLTGVQKDNMVIEYGYCIRKLTERECFRLMGVCEEYIDLIQAAGISRSQQYKIAGNSIVVDVLVAIFRQLLIGNKNAYQQLEIF